MRHGFVESIRPRPSFLLLWGALLLIYVPVYVNLLSRLWRGSAYDVSVIAPLIAGFMLWQRRDVLKSRIWEGDRRGLPILALGLAMYAGGTLASVTTLVRASLVVSVTGAIVLQGGAGMLRTLAMPVALLVFLIPSRTIFYRPLAKGLQELTAVSVGEVLGALGLLVARDGYFLALPGVTLEVTEGCSGIRSFAALSTIALAIVATVPLPRSGRWLLLLGTPLFAIGVNLARVSAIGVVAALTPIPAGFAHVVSNWLTFVASLITLMLVARRLRRSAPTRSAAQTE